MRLCEINNINQKNKRIYEMSNEGEFDIVIPVGPKDISFIHEQIKHTRKNIIGYRNIYIVLADKTLEIDGCIMIQEETFPFSLDTIAYFHGKLERNGWYLQQLIKLYASFAIPGILPRYLVVDSDTCFLQPTTFIENGKYLFNYGNEYHAEYFENLKKLHPDFEKVYPDKSGVCHHMIFERKYIKKLMNKIAEEHKEPFLHTFLKQVRSRHESGTSEYELYFNYMFKFHPDVAKLRFLKWKNSVEEGPEEEQTYITYHWFLRNKT